MPRPRRKRKIQNEPGVTYFKPAGTRMRQLSEIILSFDEYEAIRLCDHLQDSQATASQKMNISQPTFNRLLSKSRQKIAKAIVEGLAIKITGGDYHTMETSDLIGVAANAESIDSEVAANFGKSPFYLLIDHNSKIVDRIENEGISGVNNAQRLLNKGINTVIAGKIGDKSRAMFENAGIKIVEFNGKVKDAL